MTSITETAKGGQIGKTTSLKTSWENTPVQLCCIIKLATQQLEKGKKGSYCKWPANVWKAIILTLRGQTSALKRTSSK